MPLITAVAYKPTPDSKVGIKFVANRISYINNSSLFASSDLRAGQEVVSINDQPADGKSATEIAAMIASAPRVVTIKVIAGATRPNFAVAVAVPGPLESNTSRGPNGAPDGGVWYVCLLHRSHLKRPTTTDSWLTPIPFPLYLLYRGVGSYVGGATQAAACFGFLCFCLPGLLILCCPFDERDVYKAGNKVYNAEGRLLGPSVDINFRASRPNSNSMRRWRQVSSGLLLFYVKIDILVYKGKQSRVRDRLGILYEYFSQRKP